MCGIIRYMLKTYLYLPEELNKKVESAAKRQKKSKAEVLRKAIEEGINTVEEQTSSGVEVLFKLAEIGKKYNPKGPKDLSKNIDKYLWGIDEKE